MLNLSRGVSALTRHHRKQLRAGLRRHLLLIFPLLVGGMLLAGLSVAYAIPLYAVVLLLNLPFLAATDLGKDRHEGTLEFLCGLPVTGRELALSRTMALVEGCVVLGLFSAAVVPLFFSDAMGPLRLVAAGLSVFLGSSLTVVAAATFIAWLSLRFRPEYIAPAVLLFLFGPAVVLVHLGVSIGEIWTSLLALEGTLASISAMFGLASCLVTFVSFYLLARAFDRCVRDPSLARIRSR